MTVYKFLRPNFCREWEEAKRYPEFLSLGKRKWINLVKKGRPHLLDEVSDINNTDAALPESFGLLEEDKKQRALEQLHLGKFELPIVALYPNGTKELIAGNTRLTLMMKELGKGVVWSFEVPKNILDF